MGPVSEISTPLRPGDYSEPIRVLHIISGDLWGGAEAFTYDLAIEQSRRGQIVPACIVLNEGLLSRALRSAGIPTTVVDESRYGFLSLLNAASIVLRALRPAVIHSHRTKEHLLAVLLAALCRTRGYCPKVVCTVHGAPEFTRRHWDLRGRAIDAIEGVALRYGCAAVVSVSEELVNHIHDLFPKLRPVVIRNGIDVAKVKADAREPVPLGLLPERRPEEIRLAAVGRLVPIKRFDRLAPLAKRLASSTGRPVTILLIGDGPLRETLRQEFGADQGGGRVVMLGFQAPVAPIIAETDALVMTSDHEGLPIVALEAAVLGRSVFAFAVGGLAEIIGSVVPGALVPVDDITALSAAIVRSLAVSMPSRDVGRTAHAELSIQACSSRYEQLYRGLISNRSTARLRREAADQRRAQ
jgi:L-malate glycosyltransferase